MNGFFHTLKEFVRGHISARCFIAIAVVLAITGAITAGASGIVEAEAANLWACIPIWQRAFCVVIPLVALLAFSIGVVVNEKARSVRQSGREGNDQVEPVQMVEVDDFIAARKDFSIGELLSWRVRVKDGEVSPGQFASLVLCHLNQGSLNLRAARRLLREFGFDAESIERGVYTLVKKG
jgi:uncharacterized membrane protein YuzA (DUF378 family)